MIRYVDSFGYKSNKVHPEVPADTYPRRGKFLFLAEVAVIYFTLLSLREDLTNRKITRVAKFFLDDTSHHLLRVFTLQLDE